MYCSFQLSEYLEGRETDDWLRLLGSQPVCPLGVVGCIAKVDVLGGVSIIQQLRVQPGGS